MAWHHMHGRKKRSKFSRKDTINRMNMYKAKPNVEKMKLAPKDPNAGKI